MRSAILDHVYRPHTYEEVKALVTPEVAARLDPGGSYGIFWHNTKSSTYIHVAEGGAGNKVHRKRRKIKPKPREEWIAVPVPHSAIPREWVDAAREAIKYNRRLPASNRRVWELAGGLLHCGPCGAYMRHRSSLGKRNPDVWYFYYRCAGQWDYGPCGHKKMYRADETERRLWGFVRSLLTDPGRLRAGPDAMVEQERDQEWRSESRDESVARQARRGGSGAPRLPEARR